MLTLATTLVSLTFSVSIFFGRLLESSLSTDLWPQDAQKRSRSPSLKPHSTQNGTMFLPGWTLIRLRVIWSSSGSFSR